MSGIVSLYMLDISKMEKRLRFGSVTDLRFPVLCFSQSKSQRHSLVHVKQADL